MSHSRVFTEEGVVLRRKNLGEADRIISVFTRRHGKMSLLAKGIRRLTSRRSPHLDVFCQATITIHRGKTFDIVTEAQSTERHGALRTHIAKVSFGYYVCELVDRLLPMGQEQGEVFDLLVGTLEKIGQAQEETVWRHIVYSFALDLLGILGYVPPTQQPTQEAMYRFIENIIERKLHSPLLLTKIH